MNQKEYLSTFLYHGEIEASNNTVENAQRGVVVGRKNWLFCDTPDGAEASVIAYSILESAKANGLNPEKYMNHILTVLPVSVFREKRKVAEFPFSTFYYSLSKRPEQHNQLDQQNRMLDRRHSMNMYGFPDNQVSLLLLSRYQDKSYSLLTWRILFFQIF